MFPPKPLVSAQSPTSHAAPSHTARLKLALVSCRPSIPPRIFISLLVELQKPRFSYAVLILPRKICQWLSLTCHLVRMTRQRQGKSAIITCERKTRKLHDIAQPTQLPASNRPDRPQPSFHTSPSSDMGPFWYHGDDDDDVVAPLLVIISPVV